MISRRLALCSPLLALLPAMRSTRVWETFPLGKVESKFQFCISLRGVQSGKIEQYRTVIQLDNPNDINKYTELEKHAKWCVKSVADSKGMDA